MPVLSETVFTWASSQVEAGRKVYWVCPDRIHASAVDEALGKEASYGVDAISVDDFIEERWSIEGDGRKIVPKIVRSLIIREYIGNYNSAHTQSQLKVNERFICELGSFIESIHGVEITTDFLGGLTDRERAVFRIIDLYRRRLEADGWVDPMEALDSIGFSGPYAIILDTIEGVNARHRLLISKTVEPYISDVIHADSETSADHGLESVDLVPSIAIHSGDMDENEPLRLVDILAGLESNRGFVANRQKAGSGQMPITADGGLHIGVAHGAHVEPALISSLIGSEIAEGTPPSDICVVYDGSEDELQSLARFCRVSSIPLIVDINHPIADTWIYEQMFALWKITTGGEKVDLDSVVTFILNPLNGFSQEDSWLMDRRRRINRRMDGTALLSGMVRRSKECADLVTNARTIFCGAPEPQRVTAFSGFVETIHAILGRRFTSDDGILSREMKALSSLQDRFIQAWECGLEGDMGLFGMEDIPVSLSSTGAPRAESVSVRRSMELGPSRYPVIILAGLTASRYPMAHENTPFDILAERLGISTCFDEAERLTSCYLRTCHAADRKLVLEYATGDPESPDRPCALLEDTLALYGMQETSDREEDIPRTLDPFLTILDEMDDSALFAPLTEDRHVWTASLRSSGKSFTTEQRGVFRELEGLIDPDHEFSATEIERYLECPYQWFFARRLNPKKIDTDFGPIAHGNICHGALDRFYRWFTGQDIPPETVAEGFETDPDGRLIPQRHVGYTNLAMAKKLLDRAVDDYIANNTDRVYPVTAGERHAVMDFKSELRGFLETEPSFLPGYEPRRFESKFGSGSGKAIHYAGVPVTGKIDRMDIQEETGRAIIIDYKTGDVSRYRNCETSPDMSKSAGPRPIQAELYASVVAALYGYRPVGSIYRRISDGKTAGHWDRGAIPAGGGVGLYEKDGLGSDTPDATSAYQEYLSLTEEYVAERLEALLAGHIEPDPTAPRRGRYSPCGHCPASGICGVI